MTDVTPAVESEERFGDRANEFTPAAAGSPPFLGLPATDFAASLSEVGLRKCDLANPSMVADSVTVGELRELLRVRFPAANASRVCKAMSFVGTSLVGVPKSAVDAIDERSVRCMTSAHPQAMLLVRELALLFFGFSPEDLAQEEEDRRANRRPTPGIHEHPERKPPRMRRMRLIRPLNGMEVGTELDVIEATAIEMRAKRFADDIGDPEEIEAKRRELADVV